MNVYERMKGETGKNWLTKEMVDECNRLDIYVVSANTLKKVRCVYEYWGYVGKVHKSCLV